MEQHTSSSIVSDRRVRIPAVVWVMLAGIVAALLAIFVFKVAVGTVVAYGFFGFMVLSHLFMHGGHGSHGAHNSQTSSTAVGETNETNTNQKNNHAGRGGCH